MSWFPHLVVAQAGRWRTTLRVEVEVEVEWDVVLFTSSSRLHSTFFSQLIFLSYSFSTLFHCPLYTSLLSQLASMATPHAEPDGFHSIVRTQTNGSRLRRSLSQLSKWSTNERRRARIYDSSEEEEENRVPISGAEDWKMMPEIRAQQEQGSKDGVKGMLSLEDRVVAQD